jgi:hypothetical protein
MVILVQKEKFKLFLKSTLILAQSVPAVLQHHPGAPFRTMTGTQLPVRRRGVKGRVSVSYNVIK